MNHHFVTFQFSRFSKSFVTQFTFILLYFFVSICYVFSELLLKTKFFFAIITFNIIFSYTFSISRRQDRAFHLAGVAEQVRPGGAPRACGGRPAAVPRAYIRTGASWENDDDEGRAVTPQAPPLH